MAASRQGAAHSQHLEQDSVKASGADSGPQLPRGAAEHQQRSKDKGGHLNDVLGLGHR